MRKFQLDISTGKQLRNEPAKLNYLTKIETSRKTHNIPSEHGEGRSPEDAMRSSRSLRAALVTLAFLATSSAQDLDLGSLRYCGKQVLSEVDDNLSGVSVDPNDGTLVAVVNKPPMLVRYDPFASTSGCALTKREGIEASAWDSEGVTFLGASHVAVSQEADLDDPIPGQRVIVYDARTFQPTGEAYQLKALDEEPVKHNSGLEGVAYDPSTATFFVAREGKHDDGKMAVYSFQREPTLAATGGEDPDVDFSTVFRGNDAFDDAGVSMTDLAGVSFVPNRDPSLLLLSQETKTVALLRLASNQSTNDDPPVTAAVVGSLVVPDEEANQPEGVAWDHDRRRLWVVGEPNELLLWAEDCAAFPRGCDGEDDGDDDGEDDGGGEGDGGGEDGGGGEDDGDDRDDGGGEDDGDGEGGAVLGGAPPPPKKAGLEKGGVSAAAFVAVIVAGAAGYLAYARREALAERWRDVVGGGRSGGFERGRFLELSEDV